MAAHYEIVNGVIYYCPDGKLPPVAGVVKPKPKTKAKATKTKKS